jgi:hypothetical protein
VAGRAVGPEELAAQRDVLVTEAADVEVLGRRDRRSGAERCDVRRQRVDLVRGVLRVTADGLSARLGQRHPAGPDLEAHGSCPDPDEGRAVAAALGVDAVAGGAAVDEELAPLRDRRRVRRLSSRCAARAAEGGVQRADGHEHDQQQHRRREATAAQPTHRSLSSIELNDPPVT